MNTDSRRANAKAAFIAKLVAIREQQMAGTLPMTAQANAANIEALKQAAAQLRMP